MAQFRVAGEERDGDLEWLSSCCGSCIAQFVWSKCPLLSLQGEK